MTRAIFFRGLWGALKGEFRIVLYRDGFLVKTGVFFRSNGDRNEEGVYGELEGNEGWVVYL